MARPDLTHALDVLFGGAADLRTAAADMRPVTPDEFRQQRALLALAARIRSDVARIGNERHDAVATPAVASPALVTAKAA